MSKVICPGHGETRIFGTHTCRLVTLSLLYRLARRVVEVLSVHRMDALAKNAEIMVLRHLVAVLRHQVALPRFSWSDRAIIATLARLVSPQTWPAFLVTPETILSVTSSER
ncbi:MAG: hypothetical protein M0Z95_15025 [Actinomycetota bacterium]|jgi:hypothetical protein|nr:hypothetical protein [Actinomycetota bacterium]